MARERFRWNEAERRRRIEFSRYTHNLTNKILSHEGTSPVAWELPRNTLAAFQKGSLIDRNTYWEKEAPGESFGHQMVEWMGGMAQWVEQQSSNKLLEAVGLQGTPKGLPMAWAGPETAAIFAAINADLQRSGEEPLQEDALSEQKKRSLVFYANYLSSGDNTGDQPSSLINTLVAVAKVENNGNTDAIISQLQAIAPLLRVAGDEGQHVLAALAVAKTHAISSMEMVINVPPDAGLNEDEERVLTFLRAHAERAVAEDAPVKKEAEQPMQSEPLSPGDATRLGKTVAQAIPPESNAPAAPIALPEAQAEHVETRPDEEVVPSLVQTPAPENEFEVLEHTENVEQSGGSSAATFFTHLAAYSEKHGWGQVRREQLAFDPDRLELFEPPKVDKKNNPFEFFTIVRERKQYGRERGTLAIFEEPKRRSSNVLSYNTENEFLATLLAPDSLSKRVLELSKPAAGGLTPTIFAFAYEAAATPEQQNKLLTTLFKQIGKMYKSYGVGLWLHSYFKRINTSTHAWNPKDIDRLFGNIGETNNHIAKLQEKLTSGQALSKQEFFDISMYALPFDLMRVAETMAFVAKNAASANPAAAEEVFNQRK